MSRSYRKHPCSAHTCSSSEKQDKQLWHRRYRRAIRHRIMHDGEEDDYLLPHFREHSNPWSMAKDGKSYYSWQDSYYYHRFCNEEPTDSDFQDYLRNHVRK